MFKNIKTITEDWVENKNRNVTSNFKALTMCKKCFTFYYKKSWHFERPDYLEEYKDYEVPVRFVECPACLEQDIASYEQESDWLLGKG
jgi:hypothetical protein